MSFSNEEDKIHELSLEVRAQGLVLTLNGQQTTLHTEDLPEQFHLGLTGCEGIAKFYDMTIQA